MNETIELTSLENEIEHLLYKAGYFMENYKGIDALNVLNDVIKLTESNDVRCQVKADAYRTMGEALIQIGNHKEGIDYLIKCYECTTDGNAKSATANNIAIQYLQSKKTKEAMEYTDKALETATAPELFSHPYQLKGAIAAMEGDYAKALELMNKAAELAERAHCLTNLAMIIMDISAVYMSMEMPETSLSEINRAERYVKECHNLEMYRRCAIRRAKILFKMGKDTEGKELIMALDDQWNG